MSLADINTLRISYDKAADVLYLAFGKPRQGIDQEVSEGVFVRTDVRTHRAIGMTIIDFEKRFSRPIAESVPIDLTRFLASVPGH